MKSQVCSMPGFVVLCLLNVSGTALAQWNGEIVAWGSNGYGACDLPEPNSGFVAVAGGYFHSLGLKADGSIVAWGHDYYGQCDVPEPNSDFVAVAGGEGHTLGVKEDGSIVAWGRNNYGQCAVPSPNSGFVGIAGGQAHNLGLRESTGIEDLVLAGDFIQIRSVSPNPFSSSTSVVFQSPGLSSMTFQVFDIAGRLVRTQSIGNSPAGRHTITWDGRDSQGAELGSGVYFIRLRGAEQQASAKAVLVR